MVKKAFVGIPASWKEADLEPEIDGMAPEKGRRAVVLQLLAANAMFIIKGQCPVRLPIGVPDVFTVGGNALEFHSQVEYDGHSDGAIQLSDVLIHKASGTTYQVDVIEVIETGPTLCVRIGTWCTCESEVEGWGSHDELDWSEFTYRGPYLVQWLPEPKGGLTEQLCEAISERRGYGQEQLFA